MNSIKNSLLVVLLACFLWSCEQNQEARRPLSQASGSFMKKSIERNKKLVASEEDRIQAVIKKKCWNRILSLQKRILVPFFEKKYARYSYTKKRRCCFL